MQVGVLPRPKGMVSSWMARVLLTVAVALLPSNPDVPLVLWEFTSPEGLAFSAGTSPYPERAGCSLVELPTVLRRQSKPPGRGFAEIRTGKARPALDPPWDAPIHSHTPSVGLLAMRTLVGVWSHGAATGTPEGSANPEMPGIPLLIHSANWLVR